jgi:N-acetylmuramoyl-L-alanine amidase
MTAAPDSPLATLWCPSPNREPRRNGVMPDMLILHYTGMRDAAGALARLIDPAAEVSSHWLVDEDGTVYRLVDEARRAWHAGVSCWAGRPGLNDVSIGIEIVNPGHEFGYRPFPEAQMAAVVALCRDIVRRWRIPPARVLGHSDVAPLRKQDPGELFDWRRLAAEGVGLWPEDGAGIPRSVAELTHHLAHFGYDVAQTRRMDAPMRDVITAFQRHFRPERVDGVADAGTLARLDGLLACL